MSFNLHPKRIAALIKKEFYQIVRDPSTVLIAVIFPLILLVVYGVGVSLDMDNLKVGLVLEDTGSEAQSFALSLRNSKFLSVTLKRDIKEIESDIVASKERGMVVVPFYFTNYKKRPSRLAPIYVVADGSEPNTANFVQNYVSGAWYNWLTQEAISNGAMDIARIKVKPRFWFNEELDSQKFLVPGSIAIIMTLIGTLLTALVIAREWERGTIEALMATPVTMLEIYLSKLISYFCLGLFSMSVCTFVAVFIYGIPFLGSLSVLVLVSSVFLLAALATGLLISTLTRNQFLAAQIALITSFLPAFMLSGFVFEVSSMPKIIQMISNIIPAKYMVSSLLTLFLVGNVWSLLLFNIAIMALIAAVLFTFIAIKTVKRLD